MPPMSAAKMRPMATPGPMAERPRPMRLREPSMAFSFRLRRDCHVAVGETCGGYCWVELVEQVFVGSVLVGDGLADVHRSEQREDVGLQEHDDQLEEADADAHGEGEHADAHV